MDLRYRPDIDGLRAIAVLGILMFHCGVAGFGGGYVGVDVFFVISGYLISTAILRQIALGGFDWRDFYLRRVRRIFPALFAMLAVTTVVGWFTLFPLDLQAFGRSLVATLLFGSNVQAWLDAGYFDAAADTKPLLHTWSLAVEEQFYLIFPFVLTLTAGRGRRPLPVVAGLTAASAIGAVVLLRIDADGAFYLFPTRAWELMLGTLVALGALPRPSGRAAREGLALIGAALVIAPIFLYDRFTHFPGEAAMVPCLGAALLIGLGTEGTPTSVARALSMAPMRLVGLSSYSLYLWHWPIIVFTHHYVVRAFTGPEKAALIVASLAVAIVSWRLVETPFRKVSVEDRGNRLFAASGVAALGLGVLGVALIPSGFPDRWSPRMQALFDQIEVPNTSFDRFRHHPAYAGLTLPSPGWVAGLGEGPPEVAIWGDSHVGMLSPAIARALDERRVRAVSIFASGGCRPIVDTWIGLDFDTGCHDDNRAILDHLVRGPERRVVLAARWGSALFGEVTDEGRGEDRPVIAREPGVMMAVDDAKALFRTRFRATVEALLAAGKEVVVVEPLAEIPFEGKRMVFRALQRAPETARLTTSLAPYEARYREIEALLDETLAGLPVARIELRSQLCPGAVCPIWADGFVYFADNNHLTWPASSTLVPRLAAIFDAPVAPRRFGENETSPFVSR